MHGLSAEVLVQPEAVCNHASDLGKGRRGLNIYTLGLGSWLLGQLSKSTCVPGIGGRKSCAHRGMQAESTCTQFVCYATVDVDWLRLHGTYKDQVTM